jgi:hypothetical protein
MMTRHHQTVTRGGAAAAARAQLSWSQLLDHFFHVFVKYQKWEKKSIYILCIYIFWNSSVVYLIVKTSQKHDKKKPKYQNLIINH